MKNLPALLLSAAAILAPLSHGLAADTPADTTKPLMQAKLRESQNLLGALAMGDFAAMNTSAKRLVELGNHTNWYSRQTPEYELFLNNYRRNANLLAKAAEEKNLDGASLAYVQLTLSCFSCHQYIRTTHLASVAK